MGESQADGESSPKRSAPRFDPVTGMRAVADIQAEGFRAAGELIERMVRSEPDGPGPRPSSAAGDWTALVDAWTDLLQRTVAGLARPGKPGEVTVAVGSSGAGPELRLELPRQGEPGVEVWLYNGSFSDVGPLALHCGPLSDPEGNLLDGVQVRFDPAEVPLLPGRSSRAVRVSLATAGSPRRGIYRGAIQARGAPGLWLPFEVAIGPC
jgi:hypothetical protein